MNPNPPDSIALLRVHLQDKSPDELITLLLDLIQQVDEPTRQQFWNRLAPPGLATADLRYPSSEIFLAELDEFATAVEQGDYFDEEAQAYYGEDPADRDYHGLEYNPDDHAGLRALRQFLTEADSYFQAGRYDVAAAAYQTLSAVTMDGDTYETLGVDSPLIELGQAPAPIVKRYLVALQQSHPSSEFYDAALNLLARHDQPYRSYTDYFLSLLGSDEQAGLCSHLENWADELNKQEMQTFPIGIPLQLGLLIRLYTERGQADKAMAIQHRFRRRYLALYAPLLADRETAQDWSAVITYGQEVLATLPPTSGPTYYTPHDRVDPAIVRTQVARAYEALGDPKQALAVYEPVFNDRNDYDTYVTARRLAEAIAPERGRGFTSQVIVKLRNQVPQSCYLLCQVYLSEGKFEQAYNLLGNGTGYHALDALKLVAKAHLLAAFGLEARPEMGPYLQEMYAKTAESDKEPVRFLRDYLPAEPNLSRTTALARAEDLYRRIMQLHIDNGRKTYATAAYYCALLSEIAAFDGRQAEFNQFYQELRRRYSRHRALQAELAAKVGN